MYINNSYSYRMEDLNECRELTAKIKITIVKHSFIYSSTDKYFPISNQQINKCIKFYMYAYDF